jgi:hypothetical protein
MLEPSANGEIPVQENQQPTTARLSCTHCGQTISGVLPMPRMRCPHCGSLGFPDRAGLNLLTLDWECPACGAINDGTTNFCVNCSMGLTSRCLRCEAPVYGAVCLNCGTHQARLHRFQTSEADRENWIPIVQDQAEPAAQETPTAGDHALDPEARQTHTRKRSGRTRRGIRPRHLWGAVWIMAGVILLFWDQINATLKQPQVSTFFSENARCLILIGTVICGAALFPLFLRFFKWLARQAFPEP